ncbi:integrase, catalytic region, zinc finger, CCHC-type containing protein [Tanacetum coccineum]
MENLRIKKNVTIKRVYYVEGLNHNLFSVGQFCDADLEVAFRKSTCFVRDLQGNDLLTGNRGSDLYTISLQETTSSTLICFMAKASPTQAWLWHRRLSHLNFDYITLLSKKDIVTGLPKLHIKDTTVRLDETPEVLKDFLTMIQRNLQAQSISVRTDRVHGHAEDNNDDQALNASFQEDEFINPFCTRVQEIGEPSSRNIDNTDVHSFQPQSHDYRWTRDHPLEQVHGNPTIPVQTR